MIKKVSKIAVAGALSLSLLGTSIFLAPEATRVEAATPLPDNHTIQQLEVKFDGIQYAINVGKRSGTLLIRVDKPIKENDVEWLNWSRIKPTAVNFNLQFHKEYSKQSNPAPITFNAPDVYDFKSKGEPDKWSKEAGIVRQGLMRFSGYEFPNYYIGLTTYLPMNYTNDGVYYLRGNSYALKEAGQVKAYFFEGQDLVVESYERIKPEGTFPLMNKVMWGKTELWKGQLGKVTIKKPTTLWKKLDNGKFERVRDLKAGDEYRVYRYLDEQNGLYGVGAGMFVERNITSVLYETPSKRNLRLVKIMHGEE